MKKYIKQILNYSIIFFVTVLILTSFLVITAKIPKENIEENIEKSAPYLSVLAGVKTIKRYHPMTWLDLYADEMIFDIIYNIDSDKPLESVMEANYYETVNQRLKLRTQLENKTIEADTQYLRYWHGMMIFVRPLLTLFTIHGIYKVNLIIFLILIGILIGILIQKKCKTLIIAFLLSMIMAGVIFVPFCLEYIWVFLIMLVTSIIAIKLEKNGNNKLYMLFFITGILTCFFDFLTSVLITILVPIIFVLGIRKKRNSTLKENMIFLIFSLVIWFIGYCLMWLAKWVLASIVLNINAFDYVKDDMLLRIGVKENDVISLYKEVIPNNLFALFPFSFLKNRMWMIFIILASFAIFIIFRKKGKVKELIPFFIIAILPYIRYLVLLNHSYFHFFFTFREQIPTIMSVVLIYAYGMDKNIMFKKIYKKNKGEKCGKRINNINSST